MLTVTVAACDRGGTKFCIAYLALLIRQMRHVAQFFEGFCFFFR